jgi:hypothetical protein
MRFQAKKDFENEIFLAALQNLSVCHDISDNKKEAIKFSNECIRHKTHKYGP